MWTQIKLLRKISPALHVSEFTPPTFLWATAEDSLVSVEHSICMARALAQKNIRFEMHIFEEGQHGLSLGNQATAGSRDQVNHDAAKWNLKKFQLFRNNMELTECTKLNSRKKNKEIKFKI